MAKADRTDFPVTVHLFLVRRGEVLLLRRYNTGYEDGNYSVPAGHLEGDESVREAAVREAREEVGIEIHPQDLSFAGVMHRRSDDERVDFFLVAEKWTGEITIMEPDKCDALRWARFRSLPKNTIPYVKKALSNHLDGIRFDEFGWSKNDGGWGE